MAVGAVVVEVNCGGLHHWTGAGLSRFRARSPCNGQHRSRCHLTRSKLAGDKALNACDRDASSSTNLERLKFTAGDKLPAFRLANPDHLKAVFWRDGERLD